MRHLLSFTLLILWICPLDGQAQLMKKLKKKAGQGLLKEIGLEEKEEAPIEDINSNNPSSNRNNNRPGNNKGGGLKIAPPDVLANIADARSAIGGRNYSQTRFAIQEAMRGVELEIGEQILNTFPENVNGLAANKEEDQITTSGIGFVGLNIGRNYNAGDQYLDVLINNNSVMLTGVNTYLMSGYSQTGQDGDDQYKRTTVQGNKALVRYSDDSGYELSVPLGTSTLFVMQCVNFNSEDEVMTAANEFDLAKIKSLLGEN